MSHLPIRLAIAGHTGRLGREICASFAQEDGFVLAFGLGRNDNPLSTNSPGFDVLLDVSSCEGVIERLPVLQQLGKPVVIGVTGFDQKQIQQIKAAAKTLPILLSGNFSIGVNLLLQQVRDVARTLGDRANIHISETHHTAKKDFPSGTALMLADAVMQGRGQNMKIDCALHPQQPDTGQSKTIAITSFRQSGVIGQHTVAFDIEDETTSYQHTANARSIFANGALIAAKWLVDRQPGFYQMRDVLGGGLV
ncbi:4-hydroxy-tetrahydrodipicolinate reductase [hydrothermal vent metagenome]|uniref:4-hydroxy-tetrahydrodipicolinate reductase n=1 Tax=hydrothermal vent metagenome TaxID=652676 RepID=A0A3B0S268_9ZZZZ